MQRNARARSSRAHKGRNETQRTDGARVPPIPGEWKDLLRFRKKYAVACGRLESALDDYNKGKITEEKCRLIAEAAKQIAAAYEAKLRQALGS